VGGAVAAALQQSLIEAIARCERSVVSIARVRVGGESGAMASNRIGIFDPRSIEERRNPTDPDFVPNEFAAGVVLDGSGLIVTNHHVLDLEHECRYIVRTFDRRVYEARVKAADPRGDLAVLEIELRPGDAALVPMPLGDSTGLKRGQIVVTLGNPYAIARDGVPSASWGIVSNLGRKIAPDPTGRSTIHQYGALIQTDAKLNLGGSGGALVTLDGEMVGLVTSQAALAGYESPAGYAIPVDDLFRRAVDQLRTGREVAYGFLGVAPQNLPEEELARGRFGVSVDDVTPGAPAARGQIRRNDVITHINGRVIHDADELFLTAGRLPAGAEVEIALLRGDRPQRVRTTLAKYPVAGRQVVTAPRSSWRGIEVDYATTLLDVRPGSLGQRRSLPAEACVGVVRVDEGSPAWTAGFRVGDFISHVGATAVATPEEFQREVDGASGEVTLRKTVVDPRGEPFFSGARGTTVTVPAP
jgi:serine protease Do